MGHSVRYLGYDIEVDTVSFSEYNIKKSKLRRHLYLYTHIYFILLYILYTYIHILCSFMLLKFRFK